MSLRGDNPLAARIDVLVFLQEEESELARNAEMVHHPWAGREEIWGGGPSDEDDGRLWVEVLLLPPLSEPAWLKNTPWGLLIILWEVIPMLTRGTCGVVSYQALVVLM